MPKTYLNIKYNDDIPTMNQHSTTNVSNISLTTIPSTPFARLRTCQSLFIYYLFSIRLTI